MSIIHVMRGRSYELQQSMDLKDSSLAVIRRQESDDTSSTPSASFAGLSDSTKTESGSVTVTLNVTGSK